MLGSDLFLSALITRMLQIVSRMGLRELAKTTRARVRAASCRALIPDSHTLCVWACEPRVLQALEQMQTTKLLLKISATTLTRS